MDCCVRCGSRACENFARYNHAQNFEACGHAQSKKMRMAQPRSISAAELRGRR
jgi:hypothetical protein